MVSAIRSKMEGRVKLTHILLETAMVVLSSLVFFPLSMNTQHFNNNCLLNSNIFVTRHSNDSVSLDLTLTVFGNIDDCNFTTFFNVVVTIHALIWIWFYFHLDTLTARDGSHANLLLPALVTHFIFFICTIVCSVKIGDGFSNWCQQIEDNNRLPSFSLSCKDYQSLTWTERRSSFYTYNQMAQISSWIMAVFLLVSMVMTCVHLYWDFLAMQERPSVETSGFVDNGVGILNKMAMSESMEGFYTDSVESDFYGADGGAGASHDSGAAGRGASKGGKGGSKGRKGGSKSGKDGSKSGKGGSKGSSGGSTSGGSSKGGGDVHKHSDASDDDSVSTSGIVVNATIHTPVDSGSDDGVAVGASGLRNRGNAVS